MPLDWGLGHATRCIPIIKNLLIENCSIIIATDGGQQKLLQKEFPQLSFTKLRGYKIKYSKSNRALAFSIITQIPKIIFLIYKEHQWLKKIIERKSIDLVISDNRYGLYSNKLPCIFITHQLTIKATNVWIENILQKINYSFINRFTECWIPDNMDETNIAGDLSHPKKMPTIPTSYIGMLSRFEKKEITEIKYKYSFILSGPEPQRTILENLILKDIDLLKEKILLVRGKPASDESLHSNVNIEIRNHLPQIELEKVFQESEFIICRSGYTSLMEILTLQKKSIIIPTPGQTEQEYLAERLHKINWCYSVKQKNFNLIKTLNAAEQFNFQLPEFKINNRQNFIHRFLETLSKK